MEMNEEEVTDFLLKFIKKGDVVLDVGCGDCSRLKEIIKQKRIKAYGVDLLASVERENVNYRQLKAEEIDRLSKRFNLIFTVRSLHHFEAPAEFLRKAKKVLLPEGRLIIIDWKHGAKTTVSERYYRPEEVEDFLRDAGFQVEGKIIREDKQVFVARR